MIIKNNILESIFIDIKSIPQKVHWDRHVFLRIHLTLWCHRVKAITCIYIDQDLQCMNVAQRTMSYFFLIKAITFYWAISFHIIFIVNPLTNSLSKFCDNLYIFPQYLHSNLIFCCHHFAFISRFCNVVWCLRSIAELFRENLTLALLELIIAGSAQDWWLHY